MTSNLQSESHRDPQKVLFITGEYSLAPGEAQLHRGPQDGVVRSISKVKDDWKVITAQITEILSSTDENLEKESGFQIDEIEISLAFSAKGSLAFIAEAGAEASVKLTLSRKG